MSEQVDIKQVTKSQPVTEGAGVRLKRAFGFYETRQFDPFLLLDDFHSDRPEDYMAGFPWHPHRGIETITYMLQGRVEHGDSLGNKGVIGSGDVQWMTAGGGIIHQEMPEHNAEDTLLWGFQLWVNLPASQKMMHPRYRDIARSEIPEVELEGGVRVKVIAGTACGVSGPVRDIVSEPEYMDVTIPKGSEFKHNKKPGHTLIAYVFEGKGSFGINQNDQLDAESLILFSDGDFLRVAAPDEPVRFLLLSGQPINEPVAWRGPIVMNTQAELDLAFSEYQDGTFIKHD